MKIIFMYLILMLYALGMFEGISYIKQIQNTHITKTEAKIICTILAPYCIGLSHGFFMNKLLSKKDMNK